LSNTFLTEEQWEEFDDFDLESLKPAWETIHGTGENSPKYRIKC